MGPRNIVPTPQLDVPIYHCAYGLMRTRIIVPTPQLDVPTYHCAYDSA